jgi:phosphopantothenoylcysteine decarboxylase / phosphopantothenate---cysteine ligase
MNQSERKRVLLGLTGGIAAYKAAELTRLMVQASIEVQVVLTEAAARFVTPATFQALSGNPVFTDLWDARVANNMAHIELSRDCDAIVIAPASADFIAKLAHGLADDLLSTLCLARECRLLVAPAMNRQMWDHPATQRNVEQIKADAVQVLGPAAGDQACGEVGMGRMLEPAQIFEHVQALFAPKLLAGERVLITAGPTFEAIDAVRGITNRSSGKMGYALARAALDAGARVTLVSGPTEIEPPAAADLVKVTSAAQMFEAVKARAGGADIFISVAAVADYTPVKPSRSKIKKSARALTLDLAPTADILAHIASLPQPPFCVGFAAESENLHEYAEAKRKRKKLPLLAANLVQNAIGEQTNELIFFDDDGAHPLPRAPKTVLAGQLIEHIAKLYHRRRAVPAAQKKAVKQK